MPKLVDVGLRALHTLQASVRERFIKLRKDIAEGADGLRTVRLDTRLVRPSPYSGRTESSYDSDEFQELVRLIDRSRGNVQPILVRRVTEFRYEIIFGHRRHRACQLLGIPVLAVLWDPPLADAQVFEISQLENQGQKRLSAYEQGQLYALALKKKLYKSPRQLAAANDVTHTWVLKALRVAKLPPPVLAAFQDPRQVTSKHAEALEKALTSEDHAEVHRRAAELAAAGSAMPANIVVDHLLGHAMSAARGELKDDDGVLATWRLDASGRAVLTLDRELSGTKVLAQLERLLAGLRSPGAVETRFPLHPVANGALCDPKHFKTKAAPTISNRSTSG